MKHRPAVIVSDGWWCYGTVGVMMKYTNIRQQSFMLLMIMHELSNQISAH